MELENNTVRDKVNLDEIFSFQKRHSIDIIQGSDFQYGCWIDGKCYYHSLTPLHSMIFGIETYKKLCDKEVY